VGVSPHRAAEIEGARDPAARSGGSRGPDDVLEYLAGGMSEDEILADFRSLARDDVRAVSSFAAERDRRPGNAPSA
jgi:hypothetical protein